jgi:hypothetical protein
VCTNLTYHQIIVVACSADERDLREETFKNNTVLLTRCIQEQGTILGMVNTTVQPITLGDNTALSSVLVARSGTLSAIHCSKVTASILAVKVSCGIKT